MLSDQELAEILAAATSSGRGDYPGSGDVGKAMNKLRDLAPALAEEVLDRRRVGGELAKALREHAGCACWCNADDRALARWAALEVRDGV